MDLFQLPLGLPNLGYERLVQIAVVAECSADSRWIVQIHDQLQWRGSAQSISQAQLPGQQDCLLIQLFAVFDQRFLQALAALPHLLNLLFEFFECPNAFADASFGLGQGFLDGGFIVMQGVKLFGDPVDPAGEGFQFGMGVSGGTDP